MRRQVMKQTLTGYSPESRFCWRLHCCRHQQPEGRHRGCATRLDRGKKIHFAEDESIQDQVAAKHKPDSNAAF